MMATCETVTTVSGVEDWQLHKSGRISENMAYYEQTLPCNCVSNLYQFDCIASRLALILLATMPSCLMFES